MGKGREGGGEEWWREGEKERGKEGVKKGDRGETFGRGGGSRSETRGTRRVQNSLASCQLRSNKFASSLLQS